MDARILKTIEQLEGKRDQLHRLGAVLSPTIRGIAAVLRGEGLDDYASRLDEYARQATQTCGETRQLIEQLSALTDARLEQTEPRIPAPPSRG